jgi:hypothetical protein
MNLPDLVFEIESVADMSIERAAAVGRAYDVDPELRPRRVGGDPARTKVEGTLEDLILRTGLPIDWLTVRVNTRHDFEGGEIRLCEGRGGYTGWPGDGGDMQFTLIPHQVTHHVLRSWTDAEPGRLDRVADLFTRLCDAMDACYGAATLLPRRRTLPPVDVGIGQIGWLNCFGPAFVRRMPGLLTTGAPTARLANGGVVIRIADAPWDLDDEVRRPVAEALGPGAMVAAWDRASPRGVHVPSLEDHMACSPGTDEMPWVKGEARRVRADGERRRERRHAAARKRRAAAAAGLAAPAVQREAEWSTSFDAEEWRSFGRRVMRRLGGDLAGQMGTALVDEIATAAVQTEEAVAVTTDVGPVEVRWFIDDVDTVDIYFIGPRVIPALIDEIHTGWADG